MCDFLNHNAVNVDKALNQLLCHGATHDKLRRGLHKPLAKKSATRLWCLESKKRRAARKFASRLRLIEPSARSHSRHLATRD